MSQLKKVYSGGTHSYKRYYSQDDGERSVASCSRAYAHLQSCGITNPTGSVVLRYLMIDIDAHRSSSKWLDAEGALDWQKIHNHLSTKIPKIYGQIEFVTRSYSKKGIHLIIGFNPLPLDDTTKRMQSACAQIQNYIIKILNNDGLGADEGARGLNRDFSTFRNTDNILHHNNILTKRIENDRNQKDKKKKTPHLLNLLKACKKYAKEFELTGSYRLYNHSIIEAKIAKLFLYTIGLRSVDPMTTLDRNLKPIITFKFKKCTPYERVTLTFKQIEHISGLTKSSLREIDFFNCEAVNNLWEIDFDLDGNVILTAKNVTTIAKRILRASHVLSGNKDVSKRIDPRLIEPGMVQDGEKNFAICSWTLAYKWAGYDEEEALELVKSLVKSIPRHEFSRSCKESQVSSVVRSIYKHKDELTGIKTEALPQFMLKKDCTKNGLGIAGRIPAPLASSLSLLLSLPKEENLNKNPMALTGDPKIKPDLKIITSLFAESTDIKKVDITTKRSALDLSKRLYVVRRNKRIGIFNNKDELVLCITNSRHFKVSDLFKELKIKVNYDITLKSFIYPKNSSKKMEVWNKKIDKELMVIKSEIVCGKKKTSEEKKIDYKLKKGIDNNKNYVTLNNKSDFEIPF
jgi:hypothetical protein